GPAGLGPTGLRPTARPVPVRGLPLSLQARDGDGGQRGAALGWVRGPVASPATPCWRREEFVVARECGRCSSFELKSVPECGPTGFVEKISCAASKRDEYKSCRSAVLESRLFWRFVGSMMAVAAVCSVLVVWRQRALDRRALEKVRKQIESI
uniref:Protein JTB n=1 Tax=Coturnix japonica TaxID=93934 RepID=A0A8C2TR37_COTJA